MPNDTGAAPFEALREYLDQAVEQLVKDMLAQSIAYRVPADDVLRLVRRVAAIEDRSALLTLRGWALRHVIPINDFIETTIERDLTPVECTALERRLRDALGYCVLALVLVEHLGECKETR